MKMSSWEGKNEKNCCDLTYHLQMFGWGLCTALCTQDFVLKVDADDSTKLKPFFPSQFEAYNNIFVVDCFKHTLFCIMSVKETKNLSEHNLKLVNVVSNQTVIVKTLFSKGNNFRSRLKNVTS